MMTTKEFIQYAGEHSELCEKLSACTTPEDAFSIAKEAGLTDDSATFTEVMTAAKAQAEKLNDADLNSVSAAGASSVALEVTLYTAVPAAAAIAGAV